MDAACAGHGGYAMTGFVFRRLLHAFVVVAGVTVLVCVITRVVGEPARTMLPLSAPDEQRAEFERALGLDRPIWAQFLDFVAGAVQFDFGTSLWQDRPTLDIVGEALPRSLILVTAGVAL